MSEQLRDAISKAIHDPERGWWTPDMDVDRATATADGVLAMPELQAIRKALQLLDQHGGPNYLEVGLDLPPSVVTWVLDGET